MYFLAQRRGMNPAARHAKPAGVRAACKIVQRASTEWV
jgi:hypothetical protein